MAVPVTEISDVLLVAAALVSILTPRVLPVPVRIIVPVPVELIDAPLLKLDPVPTVDVPMQDTAPSTVVIVDPLIRSPSIVPDGPAIPFIVIAAAPAPTPVDSMVPPNIPIPLELDVPAPVPVMLISPVDDEIVDGEFS